MSEYGGQSPMPDACPVCDGCGETDNNEDQSERSPRTFWEGLPPQSRMAVRLGLVQFVTCEACKGTGKRAQ